VREKEKNKEMESKERRNGLRILTITFVYHSFVGMMWMVQ
jgi:hypothetical protein